VLEPTGCVAVAAPRLLAPLSTSRVTSRYPTFHWLLAAGTDGAHLEICADRACSKLLVSFDADGAGGAAPVELNPGVLFWRAFGRNGGVTGLSASATWELIVGQRSAAIDTSWGSTFDANGDGYADVIIGAPDVGNGNAIRPSIGHAYVFMGGAGGLSANAATTLSGPSDNSQFGTVSSAGDVNGDGFADAIVGAPWANGYGGSAYIYLGGPNGLSSSPALTLNGPSDSLFGGAVSNAGDINGDGYGDVIVGATSVRNGTGISQYAGAAYVYFGSATGIVSSNFLTLTGATTYSSTFSGIVASAGDVDGDGRADLVVSGTEGIPVGPSAFMDQGRAFIFQGSTMPFGAKASAVLHAPSEQSFLTFGSAADFNADGYADLMLGVLGETTELLGSPGGFSTSSSLMMAFAQQPNTTAAYSYRVVAAGDINGDGYDDAIGSYDSVYTYFGGASGASDPPVIFTPPGESASIYGYDVIRVGDINRDGYDDVVVGAKFDNQFTGRAYVYFGSATGLASTPALVLPGPDGIGGHFG
jgi:FG-GAP repeat/FG-GAP-like repeat